MDKEYIQWLQELKQKIYTTQLKASIGINEELILLYWEIGKSIFEKQTAFSWGSKVVELVATDLKRKLPGSKGFSRSNLFAMRQFFVFYKDSSIVHQAGGLLTDEKAFRFGTHCRSN